MVATVEHSIDVDVPLDVAYNQWTQFESFPEFMEGVESVTQITPRLVHWRAKIGGKEEEWDAEIVEQDPDRLISWRSTSGARNDGLVTFRAIAPNITHVAVLINYEPQGFIENLGDLMGAASRRIEGDVKRFKAFIEERGRESGAWRGEIKGHDVVSSERIGATVRPTGVTMEDLHPATSTDDPSEAARVPVTRNYGLEKRLERDTTDKR